MASLISFIMKLYLIVNHLKYIFHWAMESRQQLNQEHNAYQQQLWAALTNFSRVFKIDERPGKSEEITVVLTMVWYYRWLFEETTKQNTKEKKDLIEFCYFLDFSVLHFIFTFSLKVSTNSNNLSTLENNL